MSFSITNTYVYNRKQPNLVIIVYNRKQPNLVIIFKVTELLSVSPKELVK